MISGSVCVPPNYKEGHEGVDQVFLKYNISPGRPAGRGNNSNFTSLQSQSTSSTAAGTMSIEKYQQISQLDFFLYFSVSDNNNEAGWVVSSLKYSPPALL